MREFIKIARKLGQAIRPDNIKKVKGKRALEQMSMEVREGGGGGRQLQGTLLFSSSEGQHPRLLSVNNHRMQCIV